MTEAQAPAEVLLEHLEHLQERNLRAATLEARRNVLRRLATWLGRTDLLTADAAELRAWRRSRSHLAVRTIAAEVSHVKAFYRWTVDEGLLDVDPSTKLVVPKLPQGLPRPIEEAALTRALETAGPRVRAVLVLASSCGLRALEIAGLRWSHVLADQRPPMLLVANGKGGKQRLIPLPPSVLTAMRAAGGVDWVIPRADGKPGPNAAYRISQLGGDHLHGLGLPYSLHTLRHRLGTRLYQSTLDLRLVQATLGHSNPTTTAGYAAFAPTRAVEAILELAATTEDRAVGL